MNVNCDRRLCKTLSPAFVCSVSCFWSLLSYILPALWYKTYFLAADWSPASLSQALISSAPYKTCFSSSLHHYTGIPAHFNFVQKVIREISQGGFSNTQIPQYLIHQVAVPDTLRQNWIIINQWAGLHKIRYLSKILFWYGLHNVEGPKGNIHPIKSTLPTLCGQSWVAWMNVRSALCPHHWQPANLNLPRLTEWSLFNWFSTQPAIGKPHATKKNFKVCLK